MSRQHFLAHVKFNGDQRGRGGGSCRPRRRLLTDMAHRLGIGFITRFHIESWIAVRDSDVRGVWSPNATRAEEAAALARERGVGKAKAFTSIDSMVKDPSIDAIWICGPNHQRIANMEAIVNALESGGNLAGIACEKPLARNLAEAKKVRELVARAGVLDGYLENQVFQPSVVKGKALLWSRGAAAAGRPLPRALRGGARRPPRRVVLEGRASGWWRPQRHDVPLDSKLPAIC